MSCWQSTLFSTFCLLLTHVQNYFHALLYKNFCVYFWITGMIHCITTVILISESTISCSVFTSTSYSPYLHFIKYSFENDILQIQSVLCGMVWYWMLSFVTYKYSYFLSCNFQYVNSSVANDISKLSYDCPQLSWKAIIFPHSTEFCFGMTVHGVSLF